MALDWEDVIEESESGLRILIRSSKTDQEGRGETVGIVHGSIACPVAAVQAWCAAAGVNTGPLFRSIRKGGKIGDRLTDQSVGDIVKFHAERVGLDPALFAGHSLRAGLDDVRSHYSTDDPYLLGGEGLTNYDEGTRGCWPATEPHFFLPAAAVNNKVPVTQQDETVVSLRSIRNKFLELYNLTQKNQEP